MKNIKLNTMINLTIAMKSAEMDSIWGKRVMIFAMTATKLTRMVAVPIAVLKNSINAKAARQQQRINV